MPQADLRDTNGYDQATYDKLKSYLTEPGDLVPRRSPDGMKYMDCREYECPETHFMNKQRHVCEEIDEQEQTLMMLKSNLLLAGVILAPTALVSHRVYKNHDPRATVMRETCHEVLTELQIKDPLLDVAMELERIALSDPYFIEKKLYPNVDFYSGIIMKAIGIPMSMFTVIFAISRTIGWIAHWNEMHSDPDQKIGRPRQLYTGLAQRDFTPLDQR